MAGPAGDSSLPGREIPPHAHTHWWPCQKTEIRVNQGQRQIQFCISAGLKHLPCTGHSSPAWRCPAQQGCHCSWAAGPSWQAQRHPPPQDPTPDFHLSYTIITELEAMQLHWWSQNSKSHCVCEAELPICRGNSRIAAAQQSSWLAAALWQLSQMPPSSRNPPASLKTLFLLNNPAGKRLMSSWDSFIHPTLQVCVNDHHLLETNWEK